MVYNRTLWFAAVCLFLCISSVARAQDETHTTGSPRFTLGPTLGMSLATQGTPAPFGTDIDSGYKPGLAIGVTATLGLYRNSPDLLGFFIAAQPEVLYAHKGVNLDLDGETIGAYHLSYIEIPVLARAGFRVTPNLAPYLLFGPEFGILLTAELENSRGEFSDSKDGLKTTDVGLVFGGGVAIDIAAIKGTINVEARYDLGLTDINDTGAGGFVKNRAFFVMLGYQYGAL
jgi:opacity protein-like surface antigen